MLVFIAKTQKGTTRPTYLTDDKIYVKYSQSLIIYLNRYILYIVHYIQTARSFKNQHTTKGKHVQQTRIHHNVTPRRGLLQVRYGANHSQEISGRPCTARIQKPNQVSQTREIHSRRNPSSGTQSRDGSSVQQYRSPLPSRNQRIQRPNV